METLGLQSATVTNLELQEVRLDVDYDCPHAQLVGSLPGLSDSIASTITTREPDWQILHRRCLPKGSKTVVAFLCQPHSRGSSPLFQMIAHRLRPAFLPELTALITQRPAIVGQAKVPLLGSLWRDECDGQLKMIVWDAATDTFELLRHKASLPDTPYVCLTIPHTQVSSLQRVPM